jgi:AcrR family transcriptional regulator
VRTKTPFLAEKMLDAAGKLFGAKRFHEVRMEDIAAAAEVSKGTLYRYFRDKDEMYLALLEQASDQLVAELRSRVERADTCRDRLVGVADAVITFFDDHPHLFALIQRAEIGQDQGRAFPWQAVRDHGVRMIQDIFDDAQRSGEFTVRRPAIAMLMFLGGLRAVVRVGEHPRPEGLAQDLVDDFLQGAASSSLKRTRKPALSV